MLTDFISTLAVAGGAACVVLIVNHLGGKLAGRRLPKWAMPAAIGGAMIGFTIWNEYAWYPNARARLPEGAVVASAPGERMAYRPWTYAVPLVTRFIAVERPAAEGVPPAIFATNAYVVERWGKSLPVPVAFDCARGLRADLIGGATLAADGTLTGAEWRAPNDEDVLVRAACNGG